MHIAKPISRSFVLLTLVGIVSLLFPVVVAEARSAASWRAMADSCVANRQFAKACDAYRQAAAIYRRIGDPNGAKVLEMQADRYETQIQIFYHRSAKPENLQRYKTEKKLEPIYGTYLGAFIDREDSLSQQYMDENWQSHKDSGEFNGRMKKNHAIFFMYLAYGRPFPTQWTAHLKKYGAAAHLAFQPGSLSQIQDDEYLRGFARQAKQSGIPIFIRFAGEMNGDWTPYHGDPALYVQKFRLVATVFHREAPNAAMVWCVNDIPEHEITRYYPGESATDWVGVNFYSVTFNDNNPNRPAEWKNPADSLKFVYRTYAQKHPIMICEYGATHQSKVDMRARPDFAIDKMGQLYSAIPRLYPRVKAIHWLSMNALKHAIPGRQLNNYSLLEDETIAQRYREIIASPYYLDRVSLDRPTVATEEILALKNGEVLSGVVSLSAWVKSYEQRSRVVYSLGGKEKKSFNLPGPYEWQWDTRTVGKGSTDIKVVVYDSRGKVAGQETVRVQVRN